MSHLRVRHVADVNPPCPAWDLLPDDAELTFVPLEAVWPRRIDVSRLRTKAETASGYTRFQQGDVVVPKITPTFEGDRSTWVERIPTFVATGTTELHVVRARPGVEPRYLDYLFSSAPFLRGGEAEMIGVAGQKRVPDSWLRDFPVPIVEQTEQRAIADYLDAETARIDALIAKKQQLIHLLEERLRCAADEIVEDLIEECDLVPLKYLVRESDQRLGPGSEAQVLSVSIHHGVVPRSEIDDRESRADDFRMYKRCVPGQVVLNRMRAFQGGVGVVRHAGIVSPDYTVMSPSVQLRPDFIHFLMRSQWFVGEMVKRLRGIGSTDQGAVRTPRVNYADLGLIEIPVPSVVEQEEISRGLLRSTARITQTRVRLRQQSDLLAEHRQALITASVTSEFPTSGLV